MVETGAPFRRNLIRKQDARVRLHRLPRVPRGARQPASRSAAYSVALHGSPAFGNEQRGRRRRSTALARPTETRAVAARRPGAVGCGVKADLGPSTERAERTPRRTADASDTVSGNGGHVSLAAVLPAPHHDAEYSMANNVRTLTEHRPARRAAPGALPRDGGGLRRKNSCVTFDAEGKACLILELNVAKAARRAS